MLQQYSCLGLTGETLVGGSTMEHVAVAAPVVLVLTGITNVQ